MNTRSLLHTVMPAVFIVLAVSFIFVALKTLLGRRPMILSARWLFGIMCLAFLPSIAMPFSFGSPARLPGMITWLNPLMFIVILFFFWIQMRGYLAFAISDTYFREALLASATSLGYTVEETMSRLRIKETGQEIQVAIQGWTGTAQFKPVGRGSADVVRKLAAGMVDYFKTTSGKMNYLVSYLYLIIGGFMIASSIGIFLILKKI